MPWRIKNEQPASWASRHHWHWLTKRPEPMAKLSAWLGDQNVTWPENFGREQALLRNDDQSHRQSAQGRRRDDVPLPVRGTAGRTDRSAGVAAEIGASWANPTSQ